MLWRKILPLGHTKEKHSIIDNGMLFPIDEDYKEMGVREGWLVLSGWHWDESGILVNRYDHI